MWNERRAGVGRASSSMAGTVDSALSSSSSTKPGIVVSSCALASTCAASGEELEGRWKETAAGAALSELVGALSGVSGAMSKESAAGLSGVASSAAMESRLARGCTVRRAGIGDTAWPCGETRAGSFTLLPLT